MIDDTRQRKSWLDGFMAYPMPVGSAEAQVRRNVSHLDQRLYSLWNLGENLIYAWTLLPRGLLVLLAPHTLLIEFVGEATDETESRRRSALLQELLARRTHLPPDDFAQIASELRVTPHSVDLPFSPLDDLGLPLLAALVERYGLRLVEDRAVILLDAVGFSLRPPLHQVVQLNSLSCSVNAAYARLLDREININFARTTTGDGFYIWNRMRGVAANVELYQLMQFILADNALASERTSLPGAVPQLRACFHVGSHYEFHQSEGLNPTSFSYLVGPVTIELARMIERALPGQILVGKFETQMIDEADGRLVTLDSLDFVQRARELTRQLNGVSLAGAEIDSIACYLTGPPRHDAEGQLGDAYHIREYELTDKHGQPHRVFNAKINIHRRAGRPVLLGLRDADLQGFAARVAALW